MSAQRRRAGSAGQTLIEVTFATAVVSMVLVALLSSVIQSLRNARLSLEQTKSTQYAQEVLEWLRGTRDREGWGLFYGHLASVGADITYCLPAVASTSADLIALSTGACGEGEVIPDTNFSRELHLELLSATQVKATASVSRPGRTGTITTTIEGLLGDWE
jgi:type II secretory pathway pseudopilin PulG